MDIQKIKSSDNLDLSSDFGFMTNEFKIACDRLFKKRDEEIIKKLKSFGYDLSSDDKIKDFFENRCELHFCGTKFSRLIVDGKPVLEWSNNIVTEYKDDKINLTLGE